MPLLDVFFTMMWFFLLFRVIMDIFRSRDLGGWGKAATPGTLGVYCLLWCCGSRVPCLSLSPFSW